MQLPYRIGRYTLLSKIANGGMAEIYLGRYDGAQGFSKPVAIKRILPSTTKDAQFTTALIDEAMALVQLPHQNIVQVYELGEDGDHLFISMEYVNGVDVGRMLRALMKKGGDLPAKLALYVIAQVLQGLSFVHGVTGSDGQPLGLIHRDISPQNILCSWNGGVKIADFGIAKGGHRTAHTAVNQIKGKYAYMSPEQAAGKNIDQCIDLYATGIILFELLSGKRLYEGTSDLEVIEMVKSSRIPLEAIEHVSPELRQICAIALSHDPEDRYQSASEFLSAVNQCAVTTGQIAYGSEFGDYLKSLLPSDVHSVDERLALAVNDCGMGKTRVMTLPSQKVDKESWFHPPSFKRGLVISSLIIMGMVLPAGAAKDVPSTEQIPARVESKQVVLAQPQPQPQPQPVQSVNQPSIAEVVGSKAQPKKVAPKASAPTTGSISVSVQPWGVITIPGYVSGRESPMRGVRVKNGTHTVTVKHAPTNSKISRRVKVAGKRVRCFAKFGAKASMSCK